MTDLGRSEYLMLLVSSKSRAAASEPKYTIRCPNTLTKTTSPAQERSNHCTDGLNEYNTHPTCRSTESTLPIPETSVGLAGSL